MTNSKQPDQIGFASIEEQERAQRELDLLLAQESPIDLAAADWHKRRVNGLSEQEALDFAQWLAQSPAHTAAYDDVEHNYRLLRDLSQEETPQSHTSDANAWQRRMHAAQADSGPSQNTMQAPGHTITPQVRHSRWLGKTIPRRHLLVAGIFSVLLALAAWPAWQAWNTPRFEASYATVVGQRQELALEDGSQLSLDTNTHVNVALYHNRREIQLLDGQVLIDVAPDAKRPLNVHAGAATLRVLGTRFSVRHLANGDGAGEVDVLVEEGTVEVHAKPAGKVTHATSQTLHDKQRVQVSSTGELTAVTALPAGDIALWRSGLIRFNNTPLSEVLVELERYGPTKLAITEPQVAALQIDGMYEVNRPNRFAQLLTRLYPVKLVPREDGQTEIQLKH